MSEDSSSMSGPIGVGAMPVRSILSVASVFVVVALVAILRSPEILFHGRFWAEEGTMWWANARASNALETLLYVPDLAGYFMLNTNVSFVIAGIFPLQYQPLVVTWLAVLTMATPAMVYLCVSRSHPTLWRVVVTLFMMVGAPLLEPEVFSNAINAQVFLGLGAALILVYDDESHAPRRSLLAFLMLAGLSGMYAAILAPLFVLKALCDKPTRTFTEMEPASTGSLSTGTRLRVIGNHWAQAGVMSLCLIIQLTVFMYQRSSGKVYSTKATKLPSIQDLTVFAESNFHSLLGNRDGATAVLTSGLPSSTRTVLIGSVLVGSVLWAVVELLQQLRVRFTGSRAADSLRSDEGSDASIAYLVISYLGVSAFVLIGFADSYPHSRYQVLATSILGLCVLEMAKRILATQPLSVMAVIIVFALSTASGIRDDQRNFITCDEEICMPWVDQVKGVNEGALNSYQFWPFSGPWIVSASELTADE